MAYHEALGLTRPDFEALRESFDERTYRGRVYEHLPEARGSVERGTVLIDGAVVRGFPKIPRTLVLETGIPRQFAGPVAVEEKLNGYNVRVVRVGGEDLAFTRGGIVCPYTTWFVRDRLDLGGLFADHPSVMLCGEVVGPENPYTSQDYPGIDSLAFRAFDLRDRASGDPLPVTERRETCDAYGLPQVPTFGVFPVDEAVDAVPGIVADLDAEGREGVVMKSSDGATLLKYTTGTANRENLAYAFAVPFDYGQAFFFRRVIREAFQAVERDEPDEALRGRAASLGESILLPMVETVRDVDAGGLAGERHTVRGDAEAVEALLAHLRDLGLRLEVEADDPGGEERVVTFLKVMAASTDKTRSYLDGQIVRE